MIVDSSAIIAILLREPGHEVVLESLRSSPLTGVGAPTLVESGMVLVARIGLGGKTLVARLVQVAGISVIPFSAEHWPVAVDAFVRFGKGRHRAGLNFGDCMTYAVARLAGEPLLCLGDDFAQTDLALAL